MFSAGRGWPITILAGLVMGTLASLGPTFDALVWRGIVRASPVILLLGLVAAAFFGFRALIRKARERP